jgi:hypothetical protein
MNSEHTVGHALRAIMAIHHLQGRSRRRAASVPAMLALQLARLREALWPDVRAYETARQAYVEERAGDSEAEIEPVLLEMLAEPVAMPAVRISVELIGRIEAEQGDAVAIESLMPYIDLGEGDGEGDR